MAKYKRILRKYGPKAVGFGLNAMNLVAPQKAAEKTLDIFCTPRGGQIKSYQKKFLKKFDQRTLEYTDMPIMTYRSKGKGPRVLLCHGWESNTFRWRKIFKHFKAADYDVISVDAPAHGQSGSDRFTALLYAQMIDVVIKEYEPEVIIGHSVGGMASIFSLSFYGVKSIEKTVILAAPDRLTDITDNYFNIIGGSQRLRKSYETYFKSRYEKPMEYFSSASFAGQLHMPALIIHDEGDTINAYDEGQRIHEGWKESELYTTQGLDHSLQGIEVYDKVMEFIEK